MYAIIESGGKQYRVAEGEIVSLEKLPGEIGDRLEFPLLAVAKDGQLQAGSPYVPGAKAEATVVEHGRGRKIIVFKYKSKVKYRKKTGHRQAFTKVRIDRLA